MIASSVLAAHPNKLRISPEYILYNTLILEYTKIFGVFNYSMDHSRSKNTEKSWSSA